MAKNLLFFFLLICTVTDCGCSSPQTRTVYKEQLDDQGELYLYLQPLPQEMGPLRFIISEISIISEAGNALLPILTDKVTISGKGSTGRQKRLAIAPLPPGRYRGISLAIEQASIISENGEKELVPPGEPIRLELNFSILRGASFALFIDLSPEFLVSAGNRFTPRFAMGKTYMPPRNYLGFVSNSDENIVTVFNKKLMEVIQVIHTGVGPKGMALDQRNGLVYVAAAGDDIIEVINIATMEIIGRIRLQFGDEPLELALTPDGRTLLSANHGSGTVSLINTRSLSENERLVLDPDPAWIVVGRDGRTAYVLHTMTNTVSVIDVAGGSLVTSISLDESPVQGALSRDGDSLYIISEYSTVLLVVDTRSFDISGRIFIGSNASSVQTDPRANRVYVGKKTGEVVVVDPSTEMFIDSFAVEKGANFITIEGEENVLLVLAAAGNSIHKLNLVSKRKLAAMDTEAGGHALVVMGEL
jgi:YVTN family beta-propeller protein